MGSCPKPGCNYHSNRANNLSRHMRTHNGAPSPLRTTAVALGPHPGSTLGRRLGAGVKPYRCQEPGCGYASSDSGALRRHQRIHTGDKPAKCDWSGCNFSCVLTRLSPLCLRCLHPGRRTVVMRMVACRCGDFSNLARHKLTHTGERPFGCPKPGCDYTASQYGTLRSHSKFRQDDFYACMLD